MPTGEELISVDGSVVEKLAEFAGEFLVLRVLVDEEENDCLEEALRADFAIGLHEFEERLLIGWPVLDDVPFSVKDAADEDVVLVVGRDVKDELHLANLRQKIIDGRSSLLDHLVHVFDCLLYI